ncbi:MAG: NAD(P)H-hydrate epimerase [Patescibacteria group bacterium]
MLPTYTAQQVAAIDRYTIEECGVDILQLMEVAGMRSAEAAIKLFGEGRNIAVLAGPGGNGGDALVCAKWLKLWGREPTVYLSHEEEKLKPVTLDQLKVWKAFGGKIGGVPSSSQGFDGIIDGLLGYSLQGDPRGKSADLIRWANESQSPILALDVPSGLDATTGEARDPCIRARHTVVFGVMKKGLTVEGAKGYAGEIELVNIGFPREFPDSVLSK